MPTVNYSDEGGFLPVYTDKLVVTDPTKDQNAAAVAGVAIIVAAIAGVLTIAVCLFSVWLVCTKDYLHREGKQGIEQVCAMI